MKRLIKKTHIILVTLIIGIGILFIVLFSKNLNRNIILYIVVAVNLVLGIIYIKMRKQIFDANLIIDNQIIHIKPAIISGDPLDVFVSCFGILLDSKIIKFNQEGVSLKEVELGRDFIYLSYGTDNNIQNIKLLHGLTGENDFAEISNKFLYETGIQAIIK